MNDRKAMVDSCHEMQSSAPLLIFFCSVIPPPPQPFLGMGRKERALA